MTIDPDTWLTAEEWLAKYPQDGCILCGDPFTCEPDDLPVRWGSGVAHYCCSREEAVAL